MPNKLHQLNKRQIVWTISGLLFLTASIFAGIILNNQVRNTKIGAAGVSLALSSTTTNPKVNDVITVAVAMNTQGLSVTGSEIKIKYDPNKLLATSFTAGSFLPYVFIPGTISSGSANILLACPLDNNGFHPVSGSGLVAQLTFTVIAPGSSTITIDPTSIVSVSGQTTNNIGVLTPVQITAAVTPSPSPTPSICGGIQGIACPTGKVCIYSDGTTRPPFPDASGTCQLDVRPIPSPTPTYCGGIQGIACPTGKVCIYSDGTTRPPFPDASGTCQLDVRPIPSPTPTPHLDIQCLPQTVQVVNIGQSVSFNVANTGRNVNNIIWTAANGNPTTGTGLTFTTKFSTSGSKTVTVTDGGPVTSCSVYVNSNTPTSTPSATRTPSPVPTRSPSPSPSPVGTGYTMSQISTHNSTSNCWLLMSGKVYNVTNYISSHPGGTSVITSNCGKDATQAFANIGHSNSAKNLLAQYLIGYLISANTPTPIATKTPTPTPNINHIAGDVDGNGRVNIVDVGILIDNFGDNPLLDSRPDLNNDGKVNIVDLGIIIDNYPQ